MFKLVTVSLKRQTEFEDTLRLNKVIPSDESIRMMFKMFETIEKNHQDFAGELIYFKKEQTSTDGSVTGSAIIWTTLGSREVTVKQTSEDVHFKASPWKNGRAAEPVPFFLVKKIMNGRDKKRETNQGGDKGEKKKKKKRNRKKMPKGGKKKGGSPT